MYFSTLPVTQGRSNDSPLREAQTFLLIHFQYRKKQANAKFHHVAESLSRVKIIPYTVFFYQKGCRLLKVGILVRWLESF